MDTTAIQQPAPTLAEIRNEAMAQNLSTQVQQMSQALAMTAGDRAALEVALQQANEKIAALEARVKELEPKKEESPTKAPKK